MVVRVTVANAPPLRVPFGYFRMAPWFGIAAGLFLLILGPEVWLSRWMPGLLGATHLLVLGCMVSVMMGALIQVLPVISSTSVPGAQAISPIVRSALGVGAVAIAFGLQQQSPQLLTVAGVCLFVAFTLFLAPTVRCLVRRVGGGESLFAVRVAVGCLLLAFALGVYALTGHVAPEWHPGFRAWTDIHLGFGLLGWMTILIMAVSFQVIPMFHVAPPFSRHLARLLPIAVVVGLLLQNRWLIGGALSVFAIATLDSLRQRKRRAPDMTVRFWQSAMVMLLFATCAWWFLPVSELFLGTAFLLGVPLTVMIGMLYKIVPFLVFMHLQRRALADTARIPDLPTMHAVIPQRRAAVQFYLHWSCVLACLMAVCVVPRHPAIGDYAGAIAALSLVANFAWLAASLGGGHRRYLKTLELWAAPQSPART